MEQVFRSERRDAGEAGNILASSRVWLTALLDLLATAPRQHLAMLQQDIGYALRTLRRTPGFTLAAVLTLAVGVSATTIIFTIINAFLFRPLPVPRADELVSIATLGDQHIEMPHGVSSRDLQDYQELTGMFAGLLATSRRECG